MKNKPIKILALTSLYSQLKTKKMKKQLTSAILFAFIFLSCKKENVIDDFELNRQIDQKIFAGIIKLSDSELESLAMEKQVVLTRIIKANPKITFQQLYPKQPAIALRGDICTDNYNNAITNCNIQFAGNFLVTVIIGTGVGVVATPLAGVGIGYASMLKDVSNFKTCAAIAFNAKTQCETRK